ncbi:two-component response regulator ARR18-like [Rhododendron vialii]|uniref:two-component response regulator ARR18-like n=1 Tax=Rhododendron vialii TaxID=182163 RepID=UPI00265DB709|nr:two-component response regulator ARR18-like [Rhododendron vialii]
MPRQVKKKSDPIADGIEKGLDAAHGVVDHLLWPLKPIDSVIHGTARGVKNWLCDEHPTDNAAKPKTNTKKKPAVVSSSSDDEDDDSGDEDDSDGSESAPPCKGKGGHHNVGKFGGVKNNHANGAGNNNNVNGKLDAKMGNQKLLPRKK